ncbi:hypothetical protein F2Q69_00049556 [Brassica cretica]|uniref:Uncharacterized protein n=1 Tax=Brassica cretica TaxID=69181 RepID=A0A8S9PX36_BRACR|nr:hypothetical protein F2Q69_00049556 [Brassica cretica]
MVYNLWLGGTGTGAPAVPPTRVGGRTRWLKIKSWDYPKVVRGKDLATTTSARAVWEKIRGE